MLSRRHFAALAAAAALAFPVAARAAEPVPVVATFSVIADIARAVGGDRVAIRTLVPADSDAHVYQPTPGDAQALAAAHLVVTNGLNMEGWIDRLIKASGYKGEVVTATKGIKTITMEDDDHGHGHGKKVTDPHAWQNALNGQIYARNIAEGLAQVDPEGAATYRANAESYAAELKTLDGWVKAEIATVPAAQRKVITSHDAFGYLAAAYGITILSPQGISTEAEPSAKDVARLIRQIRKEKVKAVFIENMTDPRLIQQIARETGAVVGGTLYSDALSPAGGPADTYIKMFRYNLPLLVAGMRGGQS
ncbi:MAG: metal ABC transporter substrate-binding protein [Alphaproteobacteria bacterium]|jgi:zinc/manganese transport system substrate-binding protein|nr:metal ABC transporter substrate-binding protein [Alphaproteobacteria bacterium]